MDTNNRLRAIWHGLTSCGRNTEFVDDSDRKTFDRRLVNEGAEFYARGFTSLRASLLAGLESGKLVWNTKAFKPRKGTLLPQFLYSAWRAIFDDSGVLLNIVTVDAVSCLNQLLAVFGKIEGGHTEQSENDVITSFVKNEADVRFWNEELHEPEIFSNYSLCSLPSPYDRYKYRTEDYGLEHLTGCLKGTYHIDISLSDKEELGRQILANYESNKDYMVMVQMVARKLLGRLLSGLDPRDIHPKHGSGSSACGTPVRARYGKPRYVKSIDAIWSYSEYFFAGPSHLCDVMPGRSEVPCQSSSHVWLDDLEEYTPCAKVLLVPKDARGPRLISCEPRETMWIQQGLLSEIVKQTEAHSLTKGLVNFTDQSINQWQAYRGSINRESCTLDLKDASDRISVTLVKNLFPTNWFEAFMACRSGSTKLPDGTKIELAKFAPMGSALCFPVMALCVWSLLTAAANMAQTARAVRVSGGLTKANKSFRWNNPVYVYGDDIVVPSDFAETAQLVLKGAGLIVNTNKSFVHGSFRESCGGEYYNGWDVTPVRLRSLPTDDVPARMRVIAFHNNCYVKSGTQPSWLTALIHSWYPHVPERSIGKQACPSDDVMELVPRIVRGDSPSNADQLRCDMASYSAVLNVYRADNQRLPKRYRKVYHRTEYRYLGIKPQGIEYPVDRWSQVFRSLVNPRTEQALGWDALAKRVSYKYRWAPLH